MSKEYTQEQLAAALTKLKSIYYNVHIGYLYPYKFNSQLFYAGIDMDKSSYARIYDNFYAHIQDHHRQKAIVKEPHEDEDTFEILFEDMMGIIDAQQQEIEELKLKLQENVKNIEKEH